MPAVLSILALAPGLEAQAAPPRKLAASLERIFGHDQQRDSIDLGGRPVYRILKSGAVVGFAEVRNAMGKDQPITYLVAVDTSLALLDVDILVYREPYGGEVAYETWRKQFRGTRPGDPMEVGRDIRGISGATISVNAVTVGVRQALADFAAGRKAGGL